MQWRMRWCVLSETSFTCYKSKKMLTVTEKLDLDKMSEWFLKRIEASNTFDFFDNPLYKTSSNNLRLEICDGNISLQFECHSTEERDDWGKAIMQAAFNWADGRGKANM